MNLLTVDHITKVYTQRELFHDASFYLQDGEKVGIIGINGTGKSTLLKIMAGLEEPDAGNVVRANHLVIRYLPQMPEFDPQKGALENVLSYAQIGSVHQQEDREEHEKWNLESNAKSMMTRLGIYNFDEPVGHLSGGQRKRLALVAVLLTPCDVLLLDEPTNHLDAEMAEWLENYLKNYRGAMVMVTHDRYFLDRIASRIIELDNGKFFSCEGSYADFLIAKEQREYAEDLAESRRRSFLRREIEWVRRSPKARLRRNLGRLKRYDEIASQNAPVRTGQMELIIPRASHLGNKVVDLKNITFSRGERCLIRDFSFEFTANQKIGIVGANGCGKTTLLKLITQQLQPDSGEVFVAPTVEFNYVDQSRIALNPEHTVCEEIGEGHQFINLGEERISIWGYLKRFLFEDERINTQIKHLSGGEKARLMLAKILRGGGNFLILDEPTNDLDLVSLRILEEALADYNGCLIAVSHDRYFLNRICSHIIAFEGNGTLFNTVGDFDYYQMKKKERLAAELENKRRQETKAPAKRNVPKKLSYKEERELEALEQEIAKIEERIAEIEAMFSDPDFFARHGKQSAELQQELEERKSSLETAYARWEELESKKESFQ